MTILKKFHEIERGLIIGEVTIDGNTGSITTSGSLSIDGSGGIDINGGVRLSNSGDIDLDGYLKVLSEKTILHSLDVNNAVSLFSTLAVQQDATFQQDIIISGGDLRTTNTTFNLLNTVAETINFGGYATTINIGKTGDHQVVAKSNFRVTNILTVDDRIQATENRFVFDGSVGDEGATTLLGTLDVGQDVNFAANLDVVGTADFHNVTTVYDKLYVKTGTTTKFSVDNTNGNVVVHGTQNVKGAVDLDSTLNVDGITTLNAATTINSTLHTTGAVDLDSTLNVDGITTLNAATTINSTLHTTGDIDSDTEVITPLVTTSDVVLPNARLNAKTLTLGNWTIVQGASNNLLFKYNSTTVMSLSTDGVLTNSNDIISWGTPASS